MHGRLEGTIESEGGALTVGEQALIKAEIKVNDVLIYGKVQGNVYATGRVELRGKAEVYGDLYSNRLAMDDGVVFVGRSNALNGKNTADERFLEDVHPFGRDQDGRYSRSECDFHGESFRGLIGCKHRRGRASSAILSGSESSKLAKVLTSLRDGFFEQLSERKAPPPGTAAATPEVQRPRKKGTPGVKSNEYSQGQRRRPRRYDDYLRSLLIRR